MRQLSLLDLDADASASPPAVRHIATPAASRPPETLRSGPGGATDPLAAEAVRHALEQRLAVASGGRVALTITNNRRTMLSVRRREGVRHVRLHQMFLHASPEVVQAVGRYIVRSERFASSVIDRFIADQQHRIRIVEPAPVTLRPRGHHHDLLAIARTLAETYFDGAVSVPITWGRTGVARRRRSGSRTLRLGTYSIDDGVIRIHPVLDQAFVPHYFVEWVVFHEMLHHVVGAPVVSGRRIYHGAEFRRREATFRDFERARAWERDHIGRLLRTRAAVAARSSERATLATVD